MISLVPGGGVNGPGPGGDVNGPEPGGGVRGSAAAGRVFASIVLRIAASGVFVAILGVKHSQNTVMLSPSRTER